MAGFIADGIHIHPRALAVLIRAKGFERSILVTDAVVAAAAPVGRYHFAGMAVDRMPDGSVRQEAGHDQQEREDRPPRAGEARSNDVAGSGRRPGALDRAAHEVSQ